MTRKIKVYHFFFVSVCVRKYLLNEELEEKKELSFFYKEPG